VLRFCHERNTSASGRNDKEHQKNAMPTIAVIVYDAVNPFELGVANVSCTSHHRCFATPFTARTEEKDRQNASKGTLAVTYAKSIAMSFPRY